VNETIVTVVGNVVTEPQMRATSSGKVFLSFRIASTERRFLREPGAWRDGETFFLGVTAWRALAENAANSLGKGDPVIVRGRLRSVEWERDGLRRSAFEVEAYEIGHDLSRGRTVFSKPPRVSPDRDDADVVLEQTATSAAGPASSAGAADHVDPGEVVSPSAA
jgi:single-strand DNA-binding protein